MFRHSVKSRAITVDYRHMRDSGPHPEPDVIASYCRGQVNSDLVVDIETHLKKDVCVTFSLDELIRLINLDRRRQVQKIRKGIPEYHQNMPQGFPYENAVRGFLQQLEESLK